MSTEQPTAGPDPEAFGSAFEVESVRRQGERLLYFGEPLVGREELVRQVWPAFRESGYEVSLTRHSDEVVLVAEPVSVGVDGVPWTNVALLVGTVVTTLFAGMNWYYVRDPLSLDALRALPFAVAVMGVFGVHELGHYAMSRYHRVDASLPYFIPVPTLIGTAGAVIRMKGQIPDREALFDIGVAGPLAGLVATLVVTAVGLLLPPVRVPDWVLAQPGLVVEFGHPPLLRLVAWALGEPLSYADPRLAVNPVVYGGWVGMFVTFLNMLPVGQLDGGHILRAIVGPRQETVAAAAPAGLFGLAAYLHYVQAVGSAALIWVFWGLLTGLFALMGPARPIADEPLDRRRVAVGVLTFVLAALCFTPVPIAIVGGV